MRQNNIKLNNKKQKNFKRGSIEIWIFFIIFSILFYYVFIAFAGGEEDLLLKSFKNALEGSWDTLIDFIKHINNLYFK